MFPPCLCRTSFYSCERSGALFWGAVKLPGHDLTLSGLDFFGCKVGLGKCPIGVNCSQNFPSAHGPVKCPFSESGWWERTLFPALPEQWTLAPPPLLVVLFQALNNFLPSTCCSFPDWTCERAPLQASGAPLTLSAPILCAMNFCCLGLPGPSALSHQFKNPTGLPPNFPLPLSRKQVEQF